MISVGSCGTSERRWLFDQCPGLHLAVKITVDGITSAFVKAWKAHYAYTHGHSIGSPIPPKKYEAVLLFEAEIKAREALITQRISDESKKRQLANSGPKTKPSDYGRAR
jgi:hypothetical protein